MNMRQYKRKLMARLHYIVVDAFWQRYIDAQFEAMRLDPQEIAIREAAQEAFWKDLSSKMSQRFLVEPEPVEEVASLGSLLQRKLDGDAAVEAAKIEYVVAKKSTGEVVGTFDLEDDALAMIEKARKAKKATLVLV